MYLIRVVLGLDWHQNRFPLALRGNHAPRTLQIPGTGEDNTLKKDEILKTIEDSRRFSISASNALFV